MTLRGVLLFVTGDLEGGMVLIEDARRIQERLSDREGGGLALAIGAAAELASRAGDLLLDAGLELLELNPVIVGVTGAVAVDALACAPAPPSPAPAPTPVASGGPA